MPTCTFFGHRDCPDSLRPSLQQAIARLIAEEGIRQLEQESGQTVFIRVEPFRNFYTAEEYHQNYDLKNPEAFEKELIESGRKKL